MKKREVEKFPYGSSNLLETQVKQNFVNFCKKYNLLTLRIGLFVLINSSFASAADSGSASGSSPGGPASNQCAPSPAPNSLNVLPATKELLGIGAVALVCVAASTNWVTAMGIAACLLTIAAKASNKL